MSEFNDGGLAERGGGGLASPGGPNTAGGGGGQANRSGMGLGVNSGSGWANNPYSNNRNPGGVMAGVYGGLPGMVSRRSVLPQPVRRNPITGQPIVSGPYYDPNWQRPEGEWGWPSSDIFDGNWGPAYGTPPGGVNPNNPYNEGPYQGGIGGGIGGGYPGEGGLAGGLAARSMAASPAMASIAVGEPSPQTYPPAPAPRPANPNQGFQGGGQGQGGRFQIGAPLMRFHEQRMAERAARKAAMPRIKGVAA